MLVRQSWRSYFQKLGSSCSLSTDRKYRKIPPKKMVKKNQKPEKTLWRYNHIEIILKKRFLGQRVWPIACSHTCTQTYRQEAKTKKALLRLSDHILRAVQYQGTFQHFMGVFPVIFVGQDSFWPRFQIFWKCIQKPVRRAPIFFRSTKQIQPGGWLPPRLLVSKSVKNV